MSTPSTPTSVTPEHPPIVTPNQGLPTAQDFAQEAPDSLADATTAIPPQTSDDEQAP